MFFIDIIFAIFVIFAMLLIMETHFIIHKKIPLFTRKRWYISFMVDLAIVLGLGLYMIIKTYSGGA